MATLPAFRHTDNLDRNYNPTATIAVRTDREKSWIKKVTLCLTIACLIFLGAWVEQSDKAPNRSLMNAMFLPMDSSQEDDDAFLDTFYFIGGRPLWFDATLEGRWTSFTQRFIRSFALPPWAKPQKWLDPASRPETLIDSQRLLLVRR
jgi:hypothetical protein